MKIIFEEYGDLILQLIAATGIIAMVIDIIRVDGFLHELFVKLAESAC